MNAPSRAGFRGAQADARGDDGERHDGGIAEDHPPDDVRQGARGSADEWSAERAGEDGADRVEIEREPQSVARELADKDVDADADADQRKDEKLRSAKQHETQEYGEDAFAAAQGLLRLGSGARAPG